MDNAKITDDFSAGGTGTHDPGPVFIEYPIGAFTATVQLSPKGEFVGIVEIKVNKDFRNFRQKIATKVHPDVADYFKDDESEA